MTDTFDLFSVQYLTEPNYKPNPEYSLCAGNQVIIPRIGETVWFHSNQDVKARLKRDIGETAFIVTDICHHITPPFEHSNSKSTSIVVYCIPVVHYKDYKNGNYVSIDEQN